MAVVDEGAVTSQVLASGHQFISARTALQS